MPDSIPVEVKQKRLNQLNTLIRNIAKQKNLKFLGTVQEVLVEGKAKHGTNMYAGYNPQ